MLRIESLAKSYGDTPAIADVGFEVSEREFVCVVGPSGCGKTTLLKCMSGLLTPSGGEVVLNGTRVTRPPEEMALVFQEYSRSLMPWMSVRKNVSLPLRHKTKAERSKLVDEAVEAVGLTGFIDRYPWQLSGGMQQRVAIARALALDPKILLMDEPFGALDEMTRERLNMELLRIWQASGSTVVFVTHSISEAVFLSTRVVVMSPRPGRITGIVDIDLPQPRTEETRESHRYYELVTEVREALRQRTSEPDAPLPSSERARVEGSFG